MKCAASPQIKCAPAAQMKGATQMKCAASPQIKCAPAAQMRGAAQMKNDPLKTKCMALAVRIVNLAKWLREERKEFSLADQILRSGTSIGANLAEAHFAASRKDFLAKCKVSLKECAETLFWLELLEKTNLLTHEQGTSMSADCHDLRRLLSATCNTLEQKGKALMK